MTSGALALPLRRAEARELHERLRPQLDLLRNVGGLTVSGGEPLLQHRALRSLLELCRRDGVHVAIETSGSTPLGNIRSLIDEVDCWLFGLRPTAEGVCSPDLVADFGLACGNLAALCARSAARIVVRTPVVPGMTDLPKSLEAVADVMRRQGLGELELLPMNRHQPHYYRAMGEANPLKGIRIPSQARMRAVRRFFLDRGIQARVV